MPLVRGGYALPVGALVRRLWRRWRRRQAEIALALVDAEVARWYVPDGTLSAQPLQGYSSTTNNLFEQRRVAVLRLARAGGRDPWPSVMLLPTPAQRDAYTSRPT
jgi:hypothetical protein